MLIPRLSLILVGFALLAVLNSCKEIPPNIDFSPPPPPDTTINNIDDTVFNTLRVVVLEDFTGVGCVNCPKAHDLLADLEEAHPGQIAGISIHAAGVFSTPYPGQVDYVIPEGQEIDQLLGIATSWPCGAINRRLFPTETKLIIKSLLTWTGYVEQEIDSMPSVYIRIEHTFDSATRVLDVNVDLQFLEDLQDPMISIFVLEDSIIDLQLNPAPVGVDSFYVHNNVLRDMLTLSSGRAVIVPTDLDMLVTETFASYTIPQKMNTKHVEIMAMIHDVTVDSKYIHQAAVININD